MQTLERSFILTHMEMVCVGRDVEAAHTPVTDFHSVSMSNFFSIWEKMLHV